MTKTNKITTSLVEVINLYLTRKFDEALEVLENQIEANYYKARMWKYILLAEKGEEDISKDIQELLSEAEDKNNLIQQIGYLCAQSFIYIGLQKFEKSKELTLSASKLLSQLEIQGNFELERLDFLTNIQMGSIELGLREFQIAAGYFYKTYFSKISNEYLWHKLRAAYTILFGEREKEVTPRSLKIAEEAVEIAKKLEIGDEIRIHYRNLVRLQACSNNHEEAKKTYESMFSSYTRSSVTPKILEDFSLNLQKVENILLDAKEIFSRQPIVLDLAGDSYLFVGDIHGDLEALIRALTIWKENYKHIVFIGDIVDNGNQQLECISLISSLMLEYPERVHILRGNHETLMNSSFYGFAIESYVRHDSEIYEIALRMFKEMPIAAVIDNRIFCSHGGVGGDENGNVVQLSEIRSFKKSDNLEGNQYGVLWNDPSDDFDDKESFFGRGFRGQGSRKYGRRAVEEFCSKSNIETIIRAHSRYDQGYKRFFDGKLWSLFSSKYWDSNISPSVLGWRDEKFAIYDLWKDLEFDESYAKKLLDDLKPKK